MAGRGVFGAIPDVAVFADTQWEPENVYVWLDKLEAAGRNAPNYIPIARITRGSLRDAVFRNENSTGQRFASIPRFTLAADGSKGMGRRQCTHEFKIAPIRAYTRGLMGYAKGKRVKKHGAEVWIGISTDEAVRAKPARDAWQTNRWPLIELGYSREDCLAWMADNYPELGVPPKSACIGCPFHSDAHWADMRANDPVSWAEAVAADKAIRNQPKTNTEQFAHATRVPLDRVTFREAANAQHFNNECEGMCGV